MRPPFSESALGIAILTATLCLLLGLAASILDVLNVTKVFLLMALALGMIAVLLLIGLFIKEAWR